MSRVVGVTMVKDEADVIEHTITHLLEELVDAIVVADNGSTDGTRDVLAELHRQHPGQLFLHDDPEVGYFQSAKMSALAAGAAREHGAEWIIPFDADELWLSYEHHLADFLRGADRDVVMAEGVIVNHFETSVDVEEGNPFERMVWRHREVGKLPKVAFRWRAGAVIEQGNHDVTFPARVPRLTVHGLEVRHFPYRGFEHFKRKAVNGAAAYAATDLPYDSGAHWRSYGEILERHGEAALREVYDRWFHFLSPVDQNMVRDPAPWRRWQA